MSDRPTMPPLPPDRSRLAEVLDQAETLVRAADHEAALARAHYDALLDRIDARLAAIEQALVTLAGRGTPKRYRNRQALVTEALRDGPLRPADIRARTGLELPAIDSVCHTLASRGAVLRDASGAWRLRTPQEVHDVVPFVRPA